MNTDVLLAHARSRFDHVAARRVLKEKYEARMLFAYRGGMFRANAELIVLLQAICTDTAVILDLYDTPTLIDCAELRQLAIKCYQEQLNAWLVEFEDVSKSR